MEKKRGQFFLLVRKKIILYTMNILHAVTLVLLSAVVLLDVKVPNQVRSLGMVPVSIMLLIAVFY